MQRFASSSPAQRPRRLSSRASLASARARSGRPASVPQGNAGLRVLSARASDSEAQLAFAAITDLLEGITALGELGLPCPQRHALEVALLRAEPEGGITLDPRAIALGLLNALRSLASSQPILVAIDDVSWLDASSADAAVFAARRLRDEPIRFLLARRPGGATELELAFEPARLQRLEVPPLSVGATRRLLSERLGLSLPRRLLRRLFESAQGNPLFALELGRTLVGRDLPEIGEEIPFPETLEELLGPRVAELLPEASRVLLAVALSTDLRVSQLESVAAPSCARRSARRWRGRGRRRPLAASAPAARRRGDSALASAPAGAAAPRARRHGWRPRTASAASRARIGGSRPGRGSPGRGGGERR